MSSTPQPSPAPSWAVPVPQTAVPSDATTTQLQAIIDAQSQALRAQVAVLQYYQTLLNIGYVAAPAPAATPLELDAPAAG